jgi:hypothetical protein
MLRVHKTGAVLNLFYEESDPDRWFAFDRYPRKWVRRLIRGKPQCSGHRRVFLNLRAGLERLGISYRVNDYGYAKRNPSALACIIGKPCVLDRMEWNNPILFGASGYSHPVDDPCLLNRLAIKKILVPGPWMQVMCKPFWGDSVEAWPVGIDTELWRPAEDKRVDVLLYDKVRWEHDRYEDSLIGPIRSHLQGHGHSFIELRYGFYRESAFRAALAQCRAMIFLCEHETQGIAYQQALSCGVPILAWDRGGYWQDPSYYPHKVTFDPVSSVPYWDERCGTTFKDASAFSDAWSHFWEDVRSQRFRPRNYVLENLTLEKCARQYWSIAQDAAQ